MGEERAVSMGTQREAAARGIGLRATGIGAMQMFAGVNMAVTMAARQAERETGVILRRHWITAEDERVCGRCDPIPGLNPDGVGVDDPFQTPEDGMVYDGPIHNNCRCTVDIELG